jgi:hypothetical protein
MSAGQEETGIAWQPDADELDRLDRALAAQLTSASGMSLRASFLAGAAALSMMLLALFSTSWLDDATWELSDVADTVVQWALAAAVLMLVVSLAASLLALFPRRGWSDRGDDQLRALMTGDRDREGALGVEMLCELRKANRSKARWLRVASVTLGLAFAAIVVHGGAFVIDAEPVEPQVAGATPPAPDERSGLPSAEEQAALAAKHAPRVWLHGDERYGPADPDDFLAASHLRWLDRRDRRTVAKSVVPERLGRLCGEAPGGCYRFGGWFASQMTRPYTVSEQRAERLHPARGFFLDPPDSARTGTTGERIAEPMLYELRRVRGKLAITYWFFYGYSFPYIGVGSDTRHNLLKLAHEGDWENVDVLLDRASHEPHAVVFYGHGHPVTRGWARVERDGDHPVIYSALSSHASYPTAATERGGETKVCSPVGCSHDFREQGMRWDGWRSGVLRSAREQPWYGFGGAWGAAGPAADMTGPLGPSRYKLSSDPEPGELASVGR